MNTYDISTDPGRLQLEAIHACLTRSDWSPGIPAELVARDRSWRIPKCRGCGAS